MKQKSKKTKNKQVSSWEVAAAAFENPKRAIRIMKASRVLTLAERRKLYGSGAGKQISLRLPSEDLEAVKELAAANQRPYQQLIVIAVQQYLDRIAEHLQQGQQAAPASAEAIHHDDVA